MFEEDAVFVLVLSHINCRFLMSMAINFLQIMFALELMILFSGTHNRTHANIYIHSHTHL